MPDTCLPVSTLSMEKRVLSNKMFLYRRMFKRIKELFAISCMAWLLAACTSHAASELTVSDDPSEGFFHLTGAEIGIEYDTADGKTVRRVAELFAEDIRRVTEKCVPVSGERTQGEKAVILGTLEGNTFIKELVKSGRLDVSAIKGGWEQFVIKQVKNPVEGMDEALVIAGTDRRGVAYGAFTLSERMGVSPFYWWADVPVKKQAEVYLKADYASKKPSIKYRGIFLNDEDWGLKPWASQTLEPEVGDIGPKTYANVCELILRLKGNMMAPAMHTCTGPFYSHTENKVVADEYGILITTSHCEPLLFNNASLLEWDKNVDGEWDYSKNKERILRKLDARVKEAAGYENIYTLAMRGLHDEGMRGNLTEDEKVKMLATAIADQRDILQKYIDTPIEEIPQIFVPYKEALDLYEKGLQVPDEVTLVWVDDNYGYMKRVSNPEEQKRQGGAGVYYHTSYLGTPHDYLWLNTTPPVLMYEELKKAYDTGADRYWLLNVGDIKPMELALKTFFDIAWDFPAYDIVNINHHQAQFMASVFGSKYEADFQFLLDEYYRLAWSRKPEYMGWEREWDSPYHEQLKATEFSFDNYNDARQRLADYEFISDGVARICLELPEAYRPAFFEIFAYPMMAANQMNRKFLFAQLNKEELAKGNVSGANWAASESSNAYALIQYLNERYNTMLKGKWNGMMDVPPGFCAKYQDMPEIVFTEGVESQPIDIAPQAEQNRLDSCMVVDLREGKIIAKQKHIVRIVEGLGYDWHVLQIGEPTQQTVDPTRLDGTRVEYTLPKIEADEVTVTVSTIPFFPIYKGKSNRYGFSIDGAEPFVTENLPTEWSVPWKDQVLKNGVEARATFAIDHTKDKHILTLTCGDPGTMVQRIIIDWGGLKKSYVGPNVRVKNK